jgi:hypothetical protein
MRSLIHYAGAIMLHWRMMKAREADARVVTGIT